MVRGLFEKRKRLNSGYIGAIGSFLSMILFSVSPKPTSEIDLGESLYLTAETVGGAYSHFGSFTQLSHPSLCASIICRLRTRSP